jgi:hypothetical protein
VRTWETWQEQNNSFFWHGQGPSPKEYAKLLRLTDSAVTETDPDADVLIGGMYRRPLPEQSIRARSFLSRLYRSGLGDRFDGVAVHPYDGDVSGVIRQVKGTRKVMKRGGDARKPMYVTEIGWSTDGPRGWALVTNRRGQAKKLDRAVGKLLAHRGKYGIATVIWYSWRDHQDNECKWCGGSGLLTRSGKPKPALSRFERLAGG